MSSLCLPAAPQVTLFLVFCKYMLVLSYVKKQSTHNKQEVEREPPAMPEGSLQLNILDFPRLSWSAPKFNGFVHCLFPIHPSILIKIHSIVFALSCKQTHTHTRAWGEVISWVKISVLLTVQMFSTDQSWSNTRERIKVQPGHFLKVFKHFSFTINNHFNALSF